MWRSPSTSSDYTLKVASATVVAIVINIVIDITTATITTSAHDLPELMMLMVVVQMVDPSHVPTTTTSGSPT